MSNLIAASTDYSLPDRAGAIVAGLPDSFRVSQVDYLPNSIVWHDDQLVASVDCWGDRRLGRFREGQWTEEPGPEGWLRTPRVGDDGRLAAFHHAASADSGSMIRNHQENWVRVGDQLEEGDICDWNGVAAAPRIQGDATAWGPDGSAIRARAYASGARVIRFGPSAELPAPSGATVHQIVPSPDRSLALVSLRQGADFRSVVCCTRTARIVSPSALREPVTRVAGWIDDQRLILIRESWPGQTPLIWRWETAEAVNLWSRDDVGAVRSMALRMSDGTVHAATSTGSSPRRVHLVDEEPQDDGSVEIQIVHRGEHPVPCIVLEPQCQVIGTICYFPGGPHEPIWAEYSSLASALAMRGWRVVRVNTRTSGLRQREFRAQAPVNYGLDDVLDARAVIQELAQGPVVALGMSYGAYVASLTAEGSDRCIGAASLSGFLSVSDLAATRHAGVAKFAAAHLQQAHRHEPSARVKPLFIAHGVEDPRVPFDAIARHSGADVMLVELESEGHAIHSDRAARLAYPPLFEWLDGLVR